MLSPMYANLPQQTSKIKVNDSKQSNLQTKKRLRDYAIVTRRGSYPFEVDVDSNYLGISY